MFAYKFGFGKGGGGVGGNVLCIIHKKREDAYTTKLCPRKKRES